MSGKVELSVILFSSLSSLTFSAFNNGQVLYNSWDKKSNYFVLKYDGDTDFVAARDLLMTSCYCKKLDSKFYLYYGCNIKT